MHLADSLKSTYCPTLQTLQFSSFAPLAKYPAKHFVQFHCPGRRCARPGTHG
jgi:hypothetical protein